MNTASGILPLIGLGSILTAIVAGLFMFRVNRAQAAKINTETQQIARRTALEEAEKALDWAHKHITNLERDCDRCHERLNAKDAEMAAHEIAMNDLRSSTETLLDIIEMFVSRMHPDRISDVIMLSVTADEYLDARTSIADARRHMH